MNFQIGKFYKAGSKTQNYQRGEKLLCVNIDTNFVAFYTDRYDTSVFFVELDNCNDFEEWREPREFTITCADAGFWSWSPLLDLKSGETIKLREVL